ncbi:MAG: hypothetical protein E7Z91_01365 [Cyanobacteria bacterium SIG30]|nr:hypothetical protein [Cyanobacteria bacterium SIG30]
MAVVEVLQNISIVMDKLYDFVVKDEFLSNDFEEYLRQNEFVIETSNDLNTVLTEYLLDKKTQSGIRVLDYYAEKNQEDKKIIKAFKDSFEGIFKINKISQNTFEVYSLINEKTITLVSLIKAVNLKGIGRYDYLHARIIEFENVFYILEIFDIIGSNYTQQAYQNAIKMLIQKPNRLVWKNEEKLNKIKSESKKMHEKFIEFFGQNTIITTNKNADNLIENFNALYEGKIDDFDKNIEKINNFSYFKIEEFESDDFISNAAGGFSSHNSLYDIGLYSDENHGFFAIPFLGTFETIFRGEKVENYENCIIDFLFDDKIPPSIITKQKNALEIINKVLLNKGLETMETIDEIIKNFKSDWIENYNFSSTEALYNSELFAQYLGFKN